MALWQFKSWFVPSEFLGDRQTLEVGECEEGLWNGTKQPPTDYQSRLSAILPSRKSWHDRLLQWGTQDGDLIEIWLDGEKVESISARIDCRNLNAHFMREVFDLAHAWGFRLVYQRYRVVLPKEWDAFVRAVGDSPNLKFLQNPGEWLPKLANEISENEERN
jgi:hypothetical protein